MFFFSRSPTFSIVLLPDHKVKQLRITLTLTLAFISNKNAKFDDNIIEYNQKEKKPFPVTFGQISEKEVYLRKLDTYFAEKKIMFNMDNTK